MAKTNKRERDRRRRRAAANSHPAVEIPPWSSFERSLQGLTGRQRNKARDKAQGLAYDAMEAKYFEDAMDLARQAVEVYPGCVDALLMLAQGTSKTRLAEIAASRHIVELARQELGDEFEEYRGHFWGFLETRPYMRARARLAELLLKTWQVDEAIGHYEQMLELNPNDNQGIREVLLGCYLLTGRLDGVRRLCDSYPGSEEWSAVFGYGRVLERFLSNDLDGAAKALDKAVKFNPHVPAYLTGRKNVPDEMPEYFSPGEESEAVICADILGPAWRKNSAAPTWTKARLKG